ncbi:MAG: bifunctional DNA-formamidopyrimidine glycosylase/DNA-(apurinic or apyrimidinic site) lyase [Proteobacteria bacterium]|nr:bifunctional DNA-formamidopyrimidine glycosylase/DNA-(apurinic or apyrimidinic site) lyase [Pseudomonadota bacterium]MBU1612019.1 bifunctional DNA-formamidopyrimidine glycosylase/DNA-(apurinic or apyrimidinic site) lyase [Pseudomonadota bacterium]
MPELPEVEVIARGLNSSVTGRRIDRVEALWPTSIRGSAERFLDLVTGCTIDSVSRRAKLLLLELAPQRTLAVHLKMTGRMVHHEAPTPAKHDRIRFFLDDGSILTFADMRRFGYLAVFLPGELELWDFYNDLGPEPLEMTVEAFIARFQDSKARIKALLLDQRIVAGVGNIYADESLFLAGIKPQSVAKDIEKARLAALFARLQEVLRRSIQENGSSIRNYRDSGGNAGAFQNLFQVYGRGGEPCLHCGQLLDKIKVSGRSTVFCSVCQS